MPTRAISWAQYGAARQLEPLHFCASETNYETCWGPDSEAGSSLDSFETYAWFRARGDACLKRERPVDEWLERAKSVVIQIRK